MGGGDSKKTMAIGGSKYELVRNECSTLSESQTNILVTMDLMVIQLKFIKLKNL